MFRYLVLGLLRSGGSFHGYASMKEYRERSGLQLRHGQLLPGAPTLGGEGFVRTVANPADADTLVGHPTRLRKPGRSPLMRGSPNHPARASDAMRTSCPRARSFWKTRIRRW